MITPAARCSLTFSVEVSNLNEPPVLIDRTREPAPRKRRWLTVRILFAATTMVAITVAAFSRIPRESTIDFPMGQDENLLRFLQRNGIHGTEDRFSWNGVSTIRATPGWGIWLNENAILDHAENEDFFCVIKYEAILYGFEWTSSTRTGKCDHALLYTSCTKCRSVLPD